MCGYQQYLDSVLCSGIVSFTFQWWMWSWVFHDGCCQALTVAVKKHAVMFLITYVLQDYFVALPYPADRVSSVFIKAILWRVDYLTNDDKIGNLHLSSVFSTENYSRKWNHNLTKCCWGKMTHFGLSNPKTTTFICLCSFSNFQIELIKTTLVLSDMAFTCI